MTKLCGLKDSVIVLIGAPAHAIARVIFALAEVPWLFYFGKNSILIICKKKKKLALYCT